ncbi:hypothetical protein [Pseudoalteromonas sp. OOF1S-7]|uniref:hypothetical protein n=1 Tax=Pseudoalteromonas sp. OOF1S-7 TaxID=2917757 RepID=UPI001EF655A4|nr:hypothetical protein [Pseudoalteromonas sp. OOF1S-7]MCG7535404.1 hypothetical protein [Pseudoalteromonas sp. OOF1S-7]
MSIELKVTLLNVIILCLAYFVIYPRYAGSDLKKVSIQDLIATLVSLAIVGSVYYGSGLAFSLILFEVNWAWFTIITFTLIELPLCYWYAKRHGVKFPE